MEFECHVPALPVESFGIQSHDGLLIPRCKRPRSCELAAGRFLGFIVRLAASIQRAVQPATSSLVVFDTRQIVGSFLRESGNSGVEMMVLRQVQ